MSIPHPPTAATVRLSMAIPILLAAAVCAQAHAQDRGQAPPSAEAMVAQRPAMVPAVERRHDRREEHRALSDAVRRVERRTGGQVLSAERVPFDGRDVNRVKVVDETGRIRVYMDDPRNPRRGAVRTRDDDE